MGHFRTSVAVMQKAVNDIVAAKDAIDRQITGVGATSEGTLRGWQGEGGATLRTLMASYDSHARGLQAAINSVQQLLSEQAKTYGIKDQDASATLAGAGGGLRM